MGLRFEPVPMVGTTADPVADTARWLASDPVRALVETFDGDPAWLAGPSSTLALRLAELDGFTDQWDTRQGRERNEASELQLTVVQEETVLAAIEALGHLGTAPPRFGHYDHLLMLGGLIRACLSRPAFAAKLLADGEVTASSLTALGGHRPFVGNEFEHAAANGLPDLSEEYEALDVGTRRAFHLGEPESVVGESSEEVGGTWGIRSYRTDGGLAVHVAAAPSSEPATRRADTPDSYAFFAERIAHLQPGQRLLMITTPIYVPPQHLAAVRMLAIPYGVEVDTVGTVRSDLRPGDPLPYSATQYLLEVRATIRALRRLAEVAAGSGSPRR